MLLPPHAHFLSDQFISFPEGKNISCAEMKLIISKFNCQHFINNEEFSKQNTKSQTIGILYSGIFKGVSTCANGDKKIRALFFEPYNNVVVDCYSFENDVVSNQSIFSRKKSTLLVISKYDLNELSRMIPNFGILMRKMLTRSCEAHAHLRIEYELLTPIEKKQKLNTSFPHLITELTREEKAFLTGAGKNIF